MTRTSRQLGNFPPEYHSQARPEIAQRVPLGSGSVLDIGCGEGRLGELLLGEQRALAVDGIEMDAQAAARASGRLRSVVVADLNATLPQAVEGLQPPYDVVIAADVLEHLVDPWTVMQAVVRLTRRGGLILVSLPNVRYWAVVVPLVLRGDWTYRPSGVLDRTHLRFFTRRTATELVRCAGLELVEVTRAPAHWRKGWKRFASRLMCDFGSEQFLIVARRP